MSLVKLTSFDLSQEAYLLRSYLESNGIPSYIFDEHTVGMNLFYAQAIGGIRVMVNQNDLEKAKELLDSFLHATLRENDEVITCLACGSENMYYHLKTIRNHKLGILNMAMAFLFTVFPFYGTRHRCKDCGHEQKPT